MTSQPTIRRATAADADAVMAMVLAIAAYENDTASVTTTTERWCELLARPDVIVLMAEDGDRPVGYVSAVRSLHLWSGRDIVRLDDLYVDGDYRNAGLGRALMAEMARTAADEELLVRWEVLPDNDGGQRFYRRLGATLRHKVVALWQPDAYAAHL